MEAIDFRNPDEQARHLARYITDPSTIRAHCLNSWGNGPSIQKIVEMQERHRKATRIIEEPRDKDDMMPRLGTLPVPQPKKPMRPEPVLVARSDKTLWPRWYNPPTSFFEIRALLDSVAKDFGLTRPDLIGDRKVAIYAEARSVVVRILVDRGWSYARIGRVLGGRDHSTMMHSAKMFAIYAKQNPAVDVSYRMHKQAGWCRA